MAKKSEENPQNEKLGQQEQKNQFYSRLFKSIWENIPADFTETERLLICLAEIAKAKSERMFLEMDKIGWTLLSDFFQRYFPQHPDDADDEPFWISMEWLLRFIRTRLAFAELTSPISCIAPAE